MSFSTREEFLAAVNALSSITKWSVDYKVEIGLVEVVIVMDARTYSTLSPRLIEEGVGFSEAPYHGPLSSNNGNKYRNK